MHAHQTSDKEKQKGNGWKLEKKERFSNQTHSGGLFTIPGQRKWEESRQTKRGSTMVRLATLSLKLLWLQADLKLIKQSETKSPCVWAIYFLYQDLRGIWFFFMFWFPKYSYKMVPWLNYEVHHSTGFLKKLILLTSKDALNSSNKKVKTFIMLQTIAILNKYCSFELYIQIISVSVYTKTLSSTTVFNVDYIKKSFF